MAKTLQVTYTTLPFTIVRNSKGKKVYRIGNKEFQSPPFHQWKNSQLQAGWEELHTIYKSQHVAIMPKSELIVLDCDTLEATKQIESLVNSYNPYIVESDNGTKHFYFTPTKYAEDSLLYSKPNRVRVNDIDILKGTSLVFTPSKGNSTKKLVSQPSQLCPIPNFLVDWLQQQLMDTTIKQAQSSYTSIVTYMGPRLKTLLEQYRGSGNNKQYIQQALQYLCPSRYRPMLQPDYDPNRVEDGEGVNFLQALVARLGVDPTISLEQAKELISIIALECWDSPLPEQRLEVLLNSIPTQTYPDGSPVFVYDPNITETGLLAAFEGDGYYPVYRTPDDVYLLTNSNGGVIKTTGLRNLATTLSSSNFSLLLNGKAIPSAQIHKALKMSIEYMRTVKIVENPKKSFGFYTEDYIPYFNTYKQTKYQAIVRGEHLREDKATQIPPTIRKVIANVFYDHITTPGINGEFNDKIVINFLQFIAHKLKTLDYSPLVFQFLGRKGSGKDTLIDVILGSLFGGVGERPIKASNSQFNEDYATKAIVKIDEARATDTLREELKKLSGAVITRVEPKRQTAYYIPNISTYFVTANKAALLKEDILDRRFIPILSFKAPILTIERLHERIQLELEDFALYLRDLPPIDMITYTNATKWQDNAIKEVEDAQEADETTSGLILKFLDKLFIGEVDEELFYQVAAIPGVIVYARAGVNRLYIPLVNKPGVYLKSSRDEVFTGLTRQKIIERNLIGEVQGLHSKIVIDSNLKTYNKRIHRLKVEFTPKYPQYSKAQSIIQNILGGIEPIE